MAVVLLGLMAAVCRAQEPADPRSTGCRRPSEAEFQEISRWMVKVRAVRPNRLGLERANAARRRRGQAELAASKVKLAPTGEEMVPASEDGEATTQDVPMALPPFVDNSTLPYFPPIRSQGSLGSCAAFSTTYYQMTHMVAMARGWDVRSTSDNTNKFSPKWTYNMINGGTDSGAYPATALRLMQYHGAATWAEFPYDTNVTAWCLSTAAWRNAINVRMDQMGTIDNLDTATGLANLKGLLNNGYVLNYCTYVNSWQYTSIKNDPSTPDDDAFVGKGVCYWVNGEEGSHAMTVVGYHDDLWVDINNNGLVDSGEKGAFRIANSWGTGWRESGFTWFAYDALRAVSAVSGAPSVSRREGWWYRQATWITARPSYTPKMVAQFTVNHASRSQLQMSLGISEVSATTPATTWTPRMLNLQGGSLAFNGTTTACDGTFVLDFTDLAPAMSVPRRYYLKTYDNLSGQPATLKAFKLIDVTSGNVETVCESVPQTADGGSVCSYVDYNYPFGNRAPIASASASPDAGVMPLSVTLSGAASYDPDGSITSYAWDFGDGSTGSGETASHLYNATGTFLARLTVTDNEGVSSSTVVPIVVSADPGYPAAHVLRIDMSLIPSGQLTRGQARVYVVDAAGSPRAGVTVKGVWTGLTSGTVSGLTGADGSVTFQTASIRKASVNFTFTVTELLASGYGYDCVANVEVSDSATTSGAPGGPPVAVAAAVPNPAQAGPANTALVALDGSASSDPYSQALRQYAWTEGGAALGSGAITSALLAPGTHNITLTVTDAAGLTAQDSVTVVVYPRLAQSPQVQAAAINDGEAQRSRILSVRVTFSEGVTVTGLSTVALVNMATQAAVDLAAANLDHAPGEAQMTLGLEQVALPDGNYELRLLPDGIASLSGGSLDVDGDGQGDAGTGKFYAAVFFKLTGDLDGSRGVTAQDMLTVRTAAGREPGMAGYNAGADLNADGQVTGSDLLAVRRLLGRTVAAPPGL